MSQQPRILLLMMLVFIQLCSALYIPMSSPDIQLKNIPKKSSQLPELYQENHSTADCTEAKVESTAQDKMQPANFNLNSNQQVLSSAQKDPLPSKKYVLPENAYLLQRRDFDVGLLISNEAALIQNHVMKQNIKTKIINNGTHGNILHNGNHGGK